MAFSEIKNKMEGPSFIDFSLNKEHSEHPYISVQDWEEYNSGTDKLKLLDEMGKDKFEKMKSRYTLQVNLKPGMLTSMDEVRIVVIGKTGVGKSATANTILGRHFFLESASSTSVTSQTRMRRNKVNGRLIKVIDTPGLHDTNKSTKEIIQEIAKVMKVFADGIHAFIYVQDVSSPRFTQENKETLEFIEDLFGGGIKGFRILVYSKADTLATSTSSLDNFRDEQIEDNAQAIAHFLKDLDWRIVAVNNITTIPAEKKRNQEVITGMVDKLRQHNNNFVYTNEMFEEAVKKRKELEEKGKKMGWNPALMAAVEKVIEEDFDAAKDSKKLNKLIQHHMQREMKENARKVREARQKLEEEEANEREKKSVLRKTFDKKKMGTETHTMAKTTGRKNSELQRRKYKNGTRTGSKNQEPIQSQKQQDMERQQILEKEQEERVRREQEDRSRREAKAKQEREKVKQELEKLTEKKLKEEQKREEEAAPPEKPERGLEKVKSIEGERQDQIAGMQAAELTWREQRQRQADMEEAHLRIAAQEERDRVLLESKKVVAESEKQLQLLREALQDANTAKEASEIAREYESIFNSMVDVVKLGWNKVKKALRFQFD